MKQISKWIKEFSVKELHIRLKSGKFYREKINHGARGVAVRQIDVFKKSLFPRKSRNFDSSRFCTALYYGNSDASGPHYIGKSESRVEFTHRVFKRKECQRKSNSRREMYRRTLMYMSCRVIYLMMGLQKSQSSSSLEQFLQMRIH
jgi:hypothetical protein